jgi:hypothetical protein
MKELLRTNDPALISFIEATLKGAGIPVMILDANTSIIEGSIGAIPRRIAVGDDSFVAARRALDEAGLADELDGIK